MKTTVCIDVNKKNLVQNLKFSFTNRTTVLGELMQNARRAGATRVMFDFDPNPNPNLSTLVVTDNGCGIRAVENLLIVAESGWDAETKENEHPFGMGFMSALYSCRHFQVTSTFGHLEGDTGDALSLYGLQLDTSVDWGGVTTIVLSGFDAADKAINDTLVKLAMGFPIEVWLNGSLLRNPVAMVLANPELPVSHIPFMDTEVGWVHIRCKDSLAGLPVEGKEFIVYLQGLPVYETQYAYGRPECCHIIHLDPARFNARIPDRDKLVDESEVIALVRAVLVHQVRLRLESLKASLSPAMFVAAYTVLREWECLELLNDVEALPVECVAHITNYPVCDDELFGEFLEHPQAPVSLSDILSGKVEVVKFDEDISSEGAARHMYAWKREALVYQGVYRNGLDKGHWLFTYIKDLDSETVQVEIIGESQWASFRGCWIWLAVTFCEAYRITVGSDSVEFREYAMYEGDDAGETVIMPAGAATNAGVLTQVSSFKGEYDDFEKAAYEADCRTYEAFLVANTAANPAEALKKLLPDLRCCPNLFGKRFVVELDGEGLVETVEAA